MSENNIARTRFSPSPTGHLHLGGGRTALYDYLLARQTGGQFILRIEDTDRKRFVPEAEQEIIDGLHWLGLSWDEGPDVGGPYAPYRQSERKEIYQEYARELIASGKAYYCFCSHERLDKMRQEQQEKRGQLHYDGTCRKLDPVEAVRRADSGESCVIRFKIPESGTTIVNDTLRGEIAFENSTLDDYVIVKSDGLALYHLASVVDDHLMKITHVLRGSEWLPTFPLHSLIHRAFGWEEPAWVHLSVFLKPSGKGKMSKRESEELDKTGYSVFIKDLKDLGFVPESVVNWIALMGWSYDDHSEFFTLSDLVEKFSLGKLTPSPAAINFSKFDYFNASYIRRLPTQELAKRLLPYFIKAGYPADIYSLEKIAPIIQERIITLDDSIGMAGFFFIDDIHPSREDLIVKGLSSQESASIAEKCLKLLGQLPDVNHQTAEPPMRLLVEELGLSAGQVFGILRVAVTGQKVSPPLFESMEIIGREKVLERLQNAINILGQTH